MANGDYQRTCNKCHHTWSVPAGIAEERPNLQSSRVNSHRRSAPSSTTRSRSARTTNGLANAARVPAVRRQSFTQQKVADSPTSPQSPAEMPASVPAASTTPGGQIQDIVLNEKLISLTGDLWIEDGQGNHAFEVGQVPQHARHAVLRDLSGQPLYEISKPLAPRCSQDHRDQEGRPRIGHRPGGDPFTWGATSSRSPSPGARSSQSMATGRNREVFRSRISRRAGHRRVSHVVQHPPTLYGIQIAPGFEVPARGLAIRRCARARRGPDSRADQVARSATCSAASARSERGLRR